VLYHSSHSTSSQGYFLKNSPLDVPSEVSFLSTLDVLIFQTVDEGVQMGVATLYITEAVPLEWELWVAAEL
jgi:hypothetical protein